MSNKSDFLFGIVIGSAIGATVALLYAPRSGEETRDDLRRRGDELKETANGKVKDAVQRAEALTEQIKERTTDLAGTVRETASSLASRVETKIGGRRDSEPPVSDTV